MAYIQLGGLGTNGFRADLFANYDIFDYDNVTQRTSTGVLNNEDLNNYTEVSGQNLTYAKIDEEYQMTGGTIFGLKQVTNGVTLFEASDLNISARSLNSILESGTAEQGLRYLMSGDDTVIGSERNDVILGGVGTNDISGGGGIDTALYQGAAADYSISFATDGSIKVQGNQAFDHLTSIERLKFDDGVLALDTSGTAGQAYRVYQAAFDRTPDVAGLSHWIKAMDEGLSLDGVARGFVSSSEFVEVYGSNPTVKDFVAKLYQNVLGRDGEAGGVTYWESQLANGQSQAQVLAGFAESTENVTGVAAAISDWIWFV